MILLKILIIETVPKVKNPIDAHVRNAESISKGLNNIGHSSMVVYNGTNFSKFPSDYDFILVSYATPFIDYVEVDDFIERNIKAKIGWITNEYNLSPNGLFHKHFSKKDSFVLSNYVESARKIKCFNRHYMVNLNSLLYKELPKSEKKYNHIYYGTFRVGRESYFKKYLQNDVYLSTSAKNYKKFKNIGCNPKYIKKIDWTKPLLSLFRYSLYIEDSHTHANFNNLANRFYESIGAGCVVLFDISCLNTLNKSEFIDYEPFLINSYNDLSKFNKDNYYELLEAQKKWKLCIYNSKKIVINEINKVLCKEIGKELIDG